MSDKYDTTSIEYRTIDRFPGYRFSSDGRIESCWSRGPNPRMTGIWRNLTLVPGRRGYLLVTMKHDGRYKATHVSHLIAEAFHGPRPDGMEVRHFPDRDVANNAAANLRYGTRQENEDDKKLHGTRPRGSGNALSKVTEVDVIKMRQRFAAGETKSAIARSYGLHHSTVIDIINRKAWAHVEG